MVKQYKTIEDINGIADGYSLFVEFGLHPFAIFQVRPFKKVETAHFDIFDSGADCALHSDFVFGITPPEGIVLPVVRSFGVDEARAIVETYADALTGDNAGRDLEIPFGAVEGFLKHSLRNVAFSLTRGGCSESSIKENIRTALKGHHHSCEMRNQPLFSFDPDGRTLS